MRNELLKINESLKSVNITLINHYKENDCYIARPMSTTARGFIDDFISKCLKSKRKDLIENIDVGLIEVMCSIYNFDACGTSLSPLNYVKKEDLGEVLSDRPCKVIPENKLFKKFSDRKIAGLVLQNIEEFSECYEFLRRNVFRFDFRHSNLNSMLDAFSNSYHEHWRDYLKQLEEENKLLIGSNPSCIFWGYHQFALKQDVLVKSDNKRLKLSKDKLLEIRKKKNLKTSEEFRELNEEAKRSIIQKKEIKASEKKIKFANILNSLEKLKSSSNEEKNKDFMCTVDKYTKFLVEFEELKLEDAEEIAFNFVETELFFS